MTRLRNALTAIMLAVVTLSMIPASPAEAGGPIQTYVSSRNQAGMTVTYWFDRNSDTGKSQPIGIDICGVEEGEWAAPYFRSTYGGQTYAPSLVEDAGEGCSSYYIDPTAWRLHGFTNGQPRLELVLTASVGGGFWAWAVTGSTGSLAPNARPAPGGDWIEQNFILI